MVGPFSEAVLSWRNSSRSKGYLADFNPAQAIDKWLDHTCRGPVVLSGAFEQLEG